MAKIPKQMRAVATDKFGGMDKLAVKKLPVPSVEPDEILIRVEAAGVGVGAGVGDGLSTRTMVVAGTPGATGTMPPAVGEGTGANFLV